MLRYTSLTWDRPITSAIPALLIKDRSTFCPLPKACSYCAPGQSAGSWNDFKVILSASPVIGGRLYDLIGETELQKRLDKLRATILEHAPVEIPIGKTEPRTIWNG